jgi:hypothetical protein
MTSASFSLKKKRRNEKCPQEINDRWKKCRTFAT